MAKNATHQLRRWHPGETPITTNPFRDLIKWLISVLEVWQNDQLFRDVCSTVWAPEMYRLEAELKVRIRACQSATDLPELPMDRLAAKDLIRNIDLWMQAILMHKIGERRFRDYIPTCDKLLWATRRELDELAEWHDRQGAEKQSKEKMPDPIPVKLKPATADDSWVSGLSRKRQELVRLILANQNKEGGCTTYYVASQLYGNGKQWDEWNKVPTGAQSNFESLLKLTRQDLAMMNPLRDIDREDGKLSIKT
jgi:hypothetical protein